MLRVAYSLVVPRTKITINMDWYQYAIIVIGNIVCMYVGYRRGWNQGARWAAEETSNRIVEEMGRKLS